MIKHTQFVKTPVITDTLALQVYQRGQWVRLAWLDKPSRYYGCNGRNVTAFHFPRAVSAFNSFCQATKKKTRMNLLKIVALCLFAPRFLRDMPAPKTGPYTARVFTASPWYRRWRFERQVNGRIRAYLVARWEAFKVDWSIPSACDEIAVIWEVTK